VVLFAVVALAIRTAVLLPVLSWAGVDSRDRKLIAWFGPRGLSALLLVLLPVFAGVDGAERLFAITSLVVLISVVVHGGGIAWYLQRAARRQARTDAAPAPAPAPDPAPEPASVSPDGFAGETRGAVAERISLQEFRQLQDRGEPHVLLDVRTERSYRDDPMKAAGSRRFPPDDAVRLARERRLRPDATIVLYCT
jgi:cell volume regulation protein A